MYNSQKSVCPITTDRQPNQNKFYSRLMEEGGGYVSEPLPVGEAVSLLSAGTWIIVKKMS